MKRTLCALAAFAALGLTACDDGRDNDLKEGVGEVREDVGEGLDETGDKIGEAADETGDEAEEAKRKAE